MGQGEVILVVDDELPIREVAQASLVDSGYQVMVAEDGIEAIAVYVQHREEIKVVLLDLMMPVMDGTTAIQMLRKIKPDIKIIASSGLLSSLNSVVLSNAIVDGVLAKPYTTKELLRTLHEVLHREL
jgi:two-component system, cell cycle sensor histidine kinase and response regulator CckA